MTADISTVLLTVFFILSILWTIFHCTSALLKHRSSSSSLPLITALTIGMFFSVWLLNIPVSYVSQIVDCVLVDNSVENKDNIFYTEIKQSNTVRQ